MTKKEELKFKHEISDDEANDIVGSGGIPRISTPQLIAQHGGIASTGSDGRYVSWIICQDGFKITTSR